jgi:hypothetical protein
MAARQAYTAALGPGPADRKPDYVFTTRGVDKSRPAQQRVLLFTGLHRSRENRAAFAQNANRRDRFLFVGSASPVPQDARQLGNGDHSTLLRTLCLSLRAASIAYQGYVSLRLLNLKEQGIAPLTVGGAGKLHSKLVRGVLKKRYLFTDQ